MSNNSLTRLELSDAVVREVGLSRHESMQLVDDVLDHVSSALTEGDNVKISSFVLGVTQQYHKWHQSLSIHYK